MGRGILASILVVLAVLHGPAVPAQSKVDPKKAPPAARVKVIKVWASDTAEKEEKSKGADGAKDELKDYRKRLEDETRKKHFTIEGKVEVQDALPGKALVFPLPEGFKLEITPVLEGKGSGETLVLLLSLREGKVEKRGPYKLRGTLPLIYCTPLHQEGRKLVVIVQKLPGAQEAAPKSSK